MNIQIYQVGMTFNKFYYCSEILMKVLTEELRQEEREGQTDGCSLFL